MLATVTACVANVHAALSPTRCLPLFKPRTYRWAEDDLLRISTERTYTRGSRVAFTPKPKKRVHPLHTGTITASNTIQRHQLLALILSFPEDKADVIGAALLLEGGISS